MRLVRGIYDIYADVRSHPHRILACKAQLNMSIENVLYKFITITISIKRNNRTQM